MSTTTIRLPEDLKERVTRAANRAGMTAHSFMLDAIAEKTAQEELQDDFRETAQQRCAEIVASGKTIAWNDMRQYLERRVAGKKTIRPKARKIAR